MQILECWLKHYGKFTDYRISFHAGLNIIQGGNESGKSTVFSFIRSMLYGVQKNRSKSIDEYKLRQPWENPDHFAGAMKIHFEGQIYRIERNFLKTDQTLRVVCETEGREVPDPEVFLKRVVGGLSETDFVNTIWMGQAQAPTEARLGADIKSYLMNMERAGSAQIDVTAALDRLKKKRKELETGKKKEEDRIRDQLEANRREGDYVKAEMGRLQEKLAQIGEDQDREAFERRRPGRPDAETGAAAASDSEGFAVQRDLGPGEEGLDAEASDRRLPFLLAGLLAAAVILSLLCGTYAHSLLLKTGMALLAAAFAAGMVFVILTAKKRREGKAGGREERENRENKENRRGPTGSVRNAVPMGDRVRKAERSVEVYSRLNHLLGYRDSSVDPELENRRRRLEKALMEESGSVRRPTAEESGSVQRPTAEESGSVRRPTAGESGSVRRPTAEESGSVRRPTAGESGSVRRPTAEESGSVRRPTAEESGSVQRPTAEESGRRAALARELEEKQERLDRLRCDFDRISAQRGSGKNWEMELAAVDLARQRIEDLSAKITRESGEDFARHLSDLLHRLTGGAYTRISMDEKMDLCINTPDHLLKVPQVSYAAGSQIYLALRIAAGDLLSGTSSLPLFLDEPFAMYDDDRLKDALRFLATSGRQTLLFTCQGREKTLTKDL